MGNDHSSFRYTFGIEEEFFLVHPRSRTLATSVPRSLLHACRRRYGDAVAPELLHSQIELVSPVWRERVEDAARSRGVRYLLVERAWVDPAVLGLDRPSASADGRKRGSS